MDLAELDLSDAATMEVRHPGTGSVLTDGDGDPVAIRLYGTDSDAYLNGRRMMVNRAVRKGGRTQTAEEFEEDAISLLAACTAGWSGIDLDGKPFAYNAANAKTLYRRFPWLRDQVDAFIGDRANFSKASQPA